jgi:hypothetical protein
MLAAVRKRRLPGKIIQRYLPIPGMFKLMSQPGVFESHPNENQIIFVIFRDQDALAHSGLGNIGLISG